MLVATSDWSQGAASVVTMVALGPQVRTHVVTRRGLTFDSRFVVGAEVVRDVVTIFLLVEGHLETSTGLSCEGPVALVLEEGEFERRHATAATFRSTGEPASVIEICVARTLVPLVAGIERGARALEAETWRAARALVAARDPEGIVAALRTLLRCLARDGALGSAHDDDFAPETPEHQRVWGALAELYRRQDTAAYLEALAGLAGLSVRQLERTLATLLRRFGLHGGFRATARILRLRRAVLLLSGAGTSIGDVARTVGYGSVDAMGRAFRDAGLPPPGDVRAALRS